LISPSIGNALLTVLENPRYNACEQLLARRQAQPVGSRVADPIIHCAIPRPKPFKISVMRRPNRSTLKPQLIMTYIPIRGPPAKTHPQLCQDAIELLAPAGRNRQRWLRPRPWESRSAAAMTLQWKSEMSARFARISEL
jgi:hypothetical protein